RQGDRSADHERAVRLGHREDTSRVRAVRQQRARRHSHRRHVADVVREMVEAAGRGAAAATRDVRTSVVTNAAVLGPPPLRPVTWTARAPAKDVLTYLDQLGRWLAALRASLDNLDACAQVAQDPGAYTQDIVLAMSLWKSIDARRQELEATWDSGRVLENELAQFATLIWGRLGAPSAFTLPEACTLAAALQDRLVAVLAHDAVAGSGAAQRIEPLRAALRRCRLQATALGVPVTRIEELCAE